MLAASVNKLKKEKGMALSGDVKTKCSNEYWMNLWAPKSFDYVYVSKNIKLELKAWLEEVCSTHFHRKTSLLLLVGPTGSGKTTLVNCTCKLLNILILRWEIPLDLEYGGATAVYYESQTKRFEDFLVTSARYESVLLGTQNRKVIVVEDFPQSFFRNTEKLHDIIRNHCMTSTTPVIFICDEAVEQKLFSQPYLLELNAKQLKLKGMSPRALFMVLSRLKALYPKVVHVSTEYLKELSKEANGDCRSALLTLYCQVFGVRREEITSKNILDCIRKKEQHSKTHKEKKQNKKGRDGDLGIFHLLGQILYPKRKNIEDCASLPSVFEHDPNEIAQAAQRCPSIVLLAHENYLSTFGDINDVSAAATCLSEFDVLCNEMQDKDNIQKIAFSIMTHGLMLSNKHVIRKWNPWRKSKHFDVVSANEELKQRMKIEMPEYGVHTRTIQMELIPIVRSCNLNSKIMQVMPDFGRKNTPNPSWAQVSQEF